MDVVIEGVVEALHLAVQLVLAGMSERRMTDVVHQSQSLSEVFIQPQNRGNRTGDLRDLDGMGQAIAKVV